LYQLRVEHYFPELGNFEFPLLYAFGKLWGSLGSAELEVVTKRKTGEGGQGIFKGKEQAGRGGLP